METTEIVSFLKADAPVDASYTSTRNPVEFSCPQAGSVCPGRYRGKKSQTQDSHDTVCEFSFNPYYRAVKDGPIIPMPYMRQ